MNKLNKTIKKFFKRNKPSSKESDSREWEKNCYNLELGGEVWFISQ